MDVTMDATSRFAEFEWVSVYVAQSAVEQLGAGWGWLRLLEAFGAGAVVTKTTRLPPQTDDAVLNRGHDTSPDWWREYDAHTQVNGVVPANWSTWFTLGGIAVNSDQVVQFIATIFEEQRFSHRFRKLVKPLSAETWSDLEALAWVATQNEDFVSAVRQFALADVEQKSAMRAVAVRYLRFNVAHLFCKCGAPARRPPIFTPADCTCLDAPWTALTRELKAGSVTATVRDDNGVQKVIEPRAYRGAIFDIKKPTLSFIGVDDELLFDRDEIMTKWPEANLPDTTHLTNLVGALLSHELVQLTDSERPPLMSLQESREHVWLALGLPQFSDKIGDFEETSQRTNAQMRVETTIRAALQARHLDSYVSDHDGRWFRIPVRYWGSFHDFRALAGSGFFTELSHGGQALALNGQPVFFSRPQIVEKWPPDGGPDEDWTVSKVKAWCKKEGFTNGKKARNAFMRLKGAKGRAAWFEHIWAAAHPDNKQGRPKIRNNPK